MFSSFGAGFDPKLEIVSCGGAGRGLGLAPSMARVTVEDCLEKEENRFALVVLAATRCRQLMKGVPSFVNTKNKPAVNSLREIAAGRVRFHRPTHDVVAEYIEELGRVNL